MSTIKLFEDIKAWQKARELTNIIYKMTSMPVFRSDFPLRDQMRRAAVSIISNIAEGFERGGDKEFIHFLSIAKGSAAEIQSQLYIALDTQLIDQTLFQKLYNETKETGCIIGGFMRYLQQSKKGGMKFK